MDFSLARCCPPGYQVAFVRAGTWVCYYREKDFHEDVLVGLGRYVDRSKPPVVAQCDGSLSRPPGGDMAIAPVPAPGSSAVALARFNELRGDPVPLSIRRRGFTTVPTLDVVGGSEPPVGNPTVPGIRDRDIFGTGVTIGDVIDVGQAIFGGDGGGDPAPLVPAQEDPECPGFFSVRVGDQCVNVGDLGPGGDPAITGAVTNGAGKQMRGFGGAVKGRFGVGIVPRVEVQTVRRCPKGMALGKDGVCYDGLGRNSPKREWPMGMKPLLTPGERNAIRIAGRAAGKLQRAKKSLKRSARALEKVC